MFNKFFNNKEEKVNNPFGENKMDENQVVEDKTEDQNTETQAVEEAVSESNEETNSENTEEEQVQPKDDELEKLKNDYEALNNQFLRLAADFDNYRKRQAQEREALIKYGAEDCLKKVLEVVDNFDRAMQSVDKIDNIDKMKESFVVLYNQLNASLSKLGLEIISAQGQTFDPNLHEAVMKTPTNEYPEETVIAELQKGYKYGDKVLRPALVNVAVNE